jgi:hypothetical protein
MYYLIAATILGVLFGALLTWLSGRGARLRAEVVSDYVDALMEEGPASARARELCCKYSEDKVLLDQLFSAKKLYLAVNGAQKTDRAVDMYTR